MLPHASHNLKAASLFVGLIFGPILAATVSGVAPLIFVSVLLMAACALLVIIPLECFASLCAPATSNDVVQTGRCHAVSVIVSAYLPNEEAVILKTVQGLLRHVRPDSGDEIILAYRSPSRLPVEAALEKLAEARPILNLLKVEGGGGKADQLNEALQRATGDVVYLLDADAILDPDTLAAARVAVPPGYHAVQGRNMIRNTSHLLGKVVAVEFATKYMVSHFARSRFTGVAYFCGSNAVWHREAVRATGFSNASLVEDVEASVRADRAGFCILIDPTIGATELAPVRLKDWWRQRRRWAQGWLEAGALHTGAILSEPRFSLWKKLNWVYVIYGRRVAYGLVTFWLLLLTLHLCLGGDERGYRVLVGFICLQLISGAAQSAAVAAQCRRLGETRVLPSWLIKYALLYPLYDLLKSAATVAAIAEAASGRRDWNVTPRPPACLEGDEEAAW